jgi:hypothetical protein
MDLEGGSHLLPPNLSARARVHQTHLRFHHHFGQSTTLPMTKNGYNRRGSKSHTSWNRSWRQKTWVGKMRAVGWDCQIKWPTTYYSPLLMADASCHAINPAEKNLLYRGNSWKLNRVRAGMGASLYWYMHDTKVRAADSEVHCAITDASIVLRSSPVVAQLPNGRMMG